MSRGRDAVGRGFNGAVTDRCEMRGPGDAAGRGSNGAVTDRWEMRGPAVGGAGTG